MDTFDEEELVRLLRALVSWSVRGLIVGGIGGGTTERYYSDAAVGIRHGRLATTADVFDAIQPVVPDDRVFESRFATTSVYRIRTGAYLLLALERDAAGELDAADVPALLRHQYTAEAVLPRGGDPEDWPGWTEDDVVALSRRLGNFVLVETRERFSGRPWPDRKAALNVGGLHTNEIPANAEHRLPEHVQGRQAEFASRAPFVWPDSGRALGHGDERIWRPLVLAGGALEG